ncbi:MAG: hypothetical protein LQ349_003815 [Xanthoria aureola]|nr:MAG: hypothetical protein LQ349_003815 [Xanthoria aureola]
MPVSRAKRWQAGGRHRDGYLTHDVSQVTPNIMPDTADHAPSVCSNSTSDAQLNSDSEREATELHDYHGTSSDERVVVDGSTAPSGRSRSRSTTAGSPAIIKTFWARHVVATVPHAACRDHFALERTYLGYLRTSLALAFLGVFIAQLFRLQHSENHDPVLGFFVLGIPLSCICTGAAIFTNLLGAYRFWRQQNAMLRGKILCGGWEVFATVATVLVTLITLFVLVMAVSIDKG